MFKEQKKHEVKQTHDNTQTDGVTSPSVVRDKVHDYFYCEFGMACALVKPVQVPRLRDVTKIW
jgi:hypothetical protein